MSKIELFCTSLREVYSFENWKQIVGTYHAHAEQLSKLSNAKGQIISKGLLLSSNSPKKRTNEFVFTTTTNSFVRFLGEFEDTKKSFRNYLTFNKETYKFLKSS